MSEVCRFQIEVEVADDRSTGTVKINTEHEPSMAALMILVEHLMTMFALESAAGFDRALELLCEGARSNKIKIFKGNLVQ